MADNPNLNIRIDPYDKARIDAAAEQQHLTVSAFVRQACLLEADRILPSWDNSQPAEEFDSLQGDSQQDAEAS